VSDFLSIPDWLGARYSPSLGVVPSTSQLLSYVMDSAEKLDLSALDEYGLNYRYAPSPLDAGLNVWQPSSATNISAVGSPGSVTATASHPALASTSFHASLFRTNFATSTTAGNSSGVREATNVFWRGNPPAGAGGFLAHFRIGSGAIALSGCQACAGLTSSTALFSAEPSALTNFMGIVKDSGDTNWQFSRRTGTGTVQKINLGLAYATNQVLEATLFCPPNAGFIGVEVNSVAFTGKTNLLTATYTTDLPDPATFLGRQIAVRNGAIAASASIAMVRSTVITF
jgi:hypothetical protein